MLTTILKYLGVELIKQIGAALSSMIRSFFANKAIDKIESKGNDKKKILLEMEVARKSGNMDEYHRLFNEYSKLR